MERGKKKKSQTRLAWCDRMSVGEDSKVRTRGHGEREFVMLMRLRRRGMVSAWWQADALCVDGCYSLLRPTRVASGEARRA